MDIVSLSHLTVSSPIFDGPLSLLLHLIDHNDLSLDDLDISEITKVYLQHLSLLEEMNFDIAGEYLYLASVLVWLKSKNGLFENTLPENAESQEKIQSKADLLSQLQQLKFFQEKSIELFSRELLYKETFKRPKTKKKTLLEYLLIPMDKEGLIESYRDVLRRQKRKVHVVRKDRLSIKDALSLLKSALIPEKPILYSDLVDLLLQQKEYPLRHLFIIVFICLLELAKMGKITLWQEESSGNLSILAKEDLSFINVESLEAGLDPLLAQGPEQEQEGI